MKTLAGVLLALAGGIAIAAYLRVGDRPYYPIAGISTPEGLTFTAFSQEARGRDACREANERFVQDFGAGCPTCSVAFVRCESKDEAIKQRLALSQSVVVSRGVSLAVSGPRDLAATACMQVAQDLATRGVAGRCLIQ